MTEKELKKYFENKLSESSGKELVIYSVPLEEELRLLPILINPWSSYYNEIEGEILNQMETDTGFDSEKLDDLDDCDSIKEIMNKLVNINMAESSSKVVYIQSYKKLGLPYSEYVITSKQSQKFNLKK